jgi:eukaryotic-like serine/threonine-protein kinase
VDSDTVYIGTYDGNLYALDGSTGAKRWRAHTQNLIAGTATVANGVVYVGSTDNHVYGFDAKTGAPLWSALLGGPVQFSQPVVVNGHVFVAADKLYAFGLP